MTEKTIGAIERGQARPQLRTMRKITAALGVKPKDVAEFVAALAATETEHR